MAKSVAEIQALISGRTDGEVVEGRTVRQWKAQMNASTTRGFQDATPVRQAPVYDWLAMEAAARAAEEEEQGPEQGAVQQLEQFLQSLNPEAQTPAGQAPAGGGQVVPRYLPNQFGLEMPQGTVTTAPSGHGAGHGVTRTTQAPTAPQGPREPLPVQDWMVPTDPMVADVPPNTTPSTVPSDIAQRVGDALGFGTAVLGDFLSGNPAQAEEEVPLFPVRAPMLPANDPSLQGGVDPTVMERIDRVLGSGTGGRPSTPFDGMNEWMVGTRSGAPEAGVTPPPSNRSPNNTAPQNIVAGVGDMFNQAATLGPRAEQAAAEAGQAVADWFTVPEGQRQQAAAGAPAPSVNFTPGLPSQGQAPSQGPGLISRIVQVESSGNPTARNPASSATGLGQFIESTWMEYINDTQPELLDSMSRSQILNLRNDPTQSTNATAWYANKALGVLSDIGAPATDANIYLHHFLGPGGVENLLSAEPGAKVADVLDAGQIRANPTILGGDRTVQDVINWAEAKMGTGGGAANPPPPRPAHVGTDFAQTEQWLNAAAPQRAPEGLVNDARLATLFAGIGRGLGSVNARDAGGGALFGAFAAGAGAGAADSANLALDLDRDFELARSGYAANRADAATRMAQVRANDQNMAAETDWLNATATRDWEEGIRSEANTYDPGYDVLHASSDGIVIDSRNGQGPVFINSGADVDQWQQIEDVIGLLGEDSNAARTFKYQQMAAAPNMNVLVFQRAVVDDIVRDGLGEAVWGEAYTQALAQAEAQTTTLMGNPEIYLRERDKAVTGILAGVLQGNYSWIPQAAALGNPGAQMMLQHGTVEEPEAAMAGGL